MKGRNKTKATVKKDVNALLQKLKLFNKRNALPKQLSGGQKRRVCLGMAVIGDSSVSLIYLIFYYSVLQFSSKVITIKFVDIDFG